MNLDWQWSSSAGLNLPPAAAMPKRVDWRPMSDARPSVDGRLLSSFHALLAFPCKFGLDSGSVPTPGGTLYLLTSIRSLASACLC